MKNLIDKNLLDHLLELSRIDIDGSEEEKILLDLENILKYFKQLDEVSVKGVEPFLGSAFQKNVFREDEILKSSSEEREKCLKEAPELNEGYFQSPRIL